MNAFYSAVKHAWPANYFSIASGGDHSISRTPVRYSLFRIGPPMLTVAATGALIAQTGGVVWLGCAAVIAVHSARIGRALISDVEERQWSMFKFHSVLFLVVIATGVIAGRFHGLLRPFVPSVHEILTSLWTAIIAAVLAVYLQGRAFGRVSTRTAVLRELRRFDPMLYAVAKRTALAHRYPPMIIIALGVAESIERPRWFRFLEFHLPRGQRRTKGVFQQRGADDDLESLKLAVTNVFEKVARKRDPDDDPYAFLDRCARRQNSSSAFRELVTEVYQMLISDDPTIRRALERLDTAPATA